MDSDALVHSRFSNFVQSILLIAVMALLLGYLAFVLAGAAFAFFAVGLVIGLYWLNPWVTPTWVLRMYGARPIHSGEAPDLFRLARLLSERAGLERPPSLYLIPWPQANAFALGNRSNAAVVLSAGLLRRLTLQELAGVLAHELSHLRHNDVRVMGFADLSRRVTRTLATLGMLLLFLNLPLMLLTGTTVGWLPILVLLVAPLLADLTQLALSRVREFSADLGAAELLGDPAPMIAALIRMESPGLSWFERLTGPPQSYQHIPTILRTHPETSERIVRLRRLEGERHWPEVTVMDKLERRARRGREAYGDSGRFRPFGT